LIVYSKKIEHFVNQQYSKPIIEESWFRVLTAQYEKERECLREGGRSGSSLWKENMMIRDSVGRYEEDGSRSIYQNRCGWCRYSFRD
jgi:hypothetical protein